MALKLTPQEQAMVSEKYQHRFKTRLVVLLSPVMFFAVVCFAMVMVPGLDQELKNYLTIIQLILAADVFVAVVASLLVWRCPMCQGFLGKTWNPETCTKCGVGFR